MALRLAKLQSSLAWLYRKTVTGLKVTDKSDGLSASTGFTCDTSHATDPYFVQSTLAPGNSVTLNLSALVEPQFNTQLASTRVYSIELKFAGAAYSFQFGPSNAVSWFLSAGATITGTPLAGTPDQFSFGSGTPATIDATHKQLTISNIDGAATLAYSVALILGQGP